LPPLHSSPLTPCMVPPPPLPPPQLNIAHELNLRIAKALCLDFTHHRQQQAHATRSGVAGGGGNGAGNVDAPPSVCAPVCSPTSVMQQHLDGLGSASSGGEGITRHLSQDPERLQHALLSYLQDKHMLLLLDDADELLLNAAHRPAFKAWLKLFLDRTARTHLLLTGNLAKYERASLSGAAGTGGAPSTLTVPAGGRSTPSTLSPTPAGATPTGTSSGSSSSTAVGLHSAVGIPGHTSKVFSLGPLHPLDAAALLIHRFPRELRAEERGRMRSLADFGEQPLLKRLRGNARLIEWTAELLNHLALEQLTELLCADPVVSEPQEGATSGTDTVATNAPMPFTTELSASAQRMRFIEAHECWLGLSDEARELVTKLVELLEGGGGRTQQAQVAQALAQAGTSSTPVNGTAVVSPLPPLRPSPSPEGTTFTHSSSTVVSPARPVAYAAASHASSDVVVANPVAAPIAAVSSSAPPVSASAEVAARLGVCLAAMHLGKAQCATQAHTALSPPPPERSTSDGRAEGQQDPAGGSCCAADANAAGGPVAPAGISPSSTPPPAGQPGATPLRLWSANSAFGGLPVRERDGSGGASGEESDGYDGSAPVLSSPVSGAHGDRLRAATKPHSRHHSQPPPQ